MGFKFELKAEMLAKARTYLPLAEKEAFVSTVAPRCFDRLQIKTGEQQMPPMYAENPTLKTRYLMAALAGKYLGLPYESEEGDELLMTEESCDKYGEAHLKMQIERLKRNKDVCDTAYDLLSDYYQLEKMLNTAVSGLLTIQNDSVIRQQMVVQENMAELPELLKQLKELESKKEG